jgi:signal transduction histidine kinase
MSRYLIVKLLAITVVVLVFAVAVVWLAIDTLAAGYFVTLMEKYHISPEPAHEMFVGSVHRYLVWAFLGALLLAVGLSYLMMRKVLGPLSRMTRLSRDIAAGDFSVRVAAESRDEIGQLAQAFNRMGAGLEQLESLRRSLMIDVAHELRTPLTNIRGYLEALQDGVLAPAPETLRLLMSETMRLATLVEDVLQLAKADAAKGRLQRESFDLGRAVAAAMEPFQNAFDRKRISIQVNSPPEPLRISADAKAVARILRNLTENAAQYAPSGSAVIVEIGAADGRAHLAFANPAGELSAEDLPLIFERFYRGEKSRSREHGGAGIGLAIVKELVAAHGGSVAADLAGGRLKIRITLPLS